ncbi:TOBE domain-containing protein [Sulfurimonas sp. MAG313]|nr:TOBE domain-containing protein [Sulfurimonas sp. MAG313]MDF1881097.1 TOBE domain-containing protein [Sulfurimonas sp. MAG313]
MNYITAHISKIQSIDTINVVSFISHDQSLKMMSLELDASLQVGTQLRLGTKSSNVSLAKAFSGELSIDNQLPCTISGFEVGELLVVVKLNFFDTMIESIITKDSFVRMKLQKGDAVIALIKSSELSIVEVL